MSEPLTIRATLDGVPMALDAMAAAHLLALPAPQGDGGPVVSAMEGRFTIQRGLAVVPIRGVLTPNAFIYEKYLGWSTYQGIEDTCAALARDPDVRAVVLEVDSPGGFVLGGAGAAAAIAALAGVKPVHALVRPLAASAAYWLASQANTIAVTPGAQVGSIGCMLTAWSYVQPGSSGAQMVDMVSSHARAKAPNPFDDAGRAELQRKLDQSEAQFHAAVIAGRGLDAAAFLRAVSVTDDDRDGGAVFDGAEAVARGLADTVETAPDFYARVSAMVSPSASGRARSAAFRATAKASARMARIKAAG